MLQPVPWLVALAKQLNVFSLLTGLIPLLIGFRYWQRLALPLRLVVLTILVQGIWSLLAEVGRYVWHYNILFLHLLTICETLGFALTYVLVLRRQKPRRVLLLLLGVFLAVAFYETIVRHGYQARGPNNVATVALQFVVLLSAVLLYFDQILHELHAILLERDPLFLVSVGITLYYAGTVLVNIAAEYMRETTDPGIIWTMFIVQFVMLVFFNLTLALALWYAAHPDTGSSSEQRLAE